MCSYWFFNISHFSLNSLYSWHKAESFELSISHFGIDTYVILSNRKNVTNHSSVTLGVVMHPFIQPLIAALEVLPLLCHYLLDYDIPIRLWYPAQWCILLVVSVPPLRRCFMLMWPANGWPNCSYWSPWSDNLQDMTFASHHLYPAGLLLGLCCAIIWSIYHRKGSVDVWWYSAFLLDTEQSLLCKSLTESFYLTEISYMYTTLYVIMMQWYVMYHTTLQC